MRARLTFLASLLICGTAAIVVASSSAPSVAQNAPRQQKDFIIAGNDGYGTQACLSKQGGCGKVMADAWCATKGFKGSLAYRQLDRDEITGSAPTNGSKPVDSFLVSCKE